ncbi:MAG TPA: ribosomal protein S18-alanine N-acetyltransferase [Polyangia bacterium]|nr:ribosomal protein S18-alanine N-acetyltransferase [Polyangia bacterium]
MATRERQRRFEIVPMRATDLDAIMDIERVSFRAPWSRQVFVEELDRDWAHVDVLRDRQLGQGVLAFCNYWLVRDEVHILNVAVHPEGRRQGHASRLLEHVIAFASRHKCRYLTLEVRRSNAGAIRLYRKYGFRPVGVRPNYYVEDNEDAIVMLLELSAPIV